VVANGDYVGSFSLEAILGCLKSVSRCRRQRCGLRLAARSLKCSSAYKAAVDYSGPTVILARTSKGLDWAGGRRNKRYPPAEDTKRRKISEFVLSLGFLGAMKRLQKCRF